MISARDSEYVIEHAHVPEHVVDYVTAMSEAEPFLLGDFLVYVKKRHLIFVGYPLSETFIDTEMKKVLDEAVKRFKPEGVALTAPSLPRWIAGGEKVETDRYYKLDLSRLSIPQKVRNMLTRARQEVAITRNRTFLDEHQQLIADFLSSHPVGEETRSIFLRLDRYLSVSKTAWIYEARSREGRLVALDVAEFRPRHYALYMFNFRSSACPVPGVSDLLFSEVIQHALAEEKRVVNMGLGINAGVTFFKEKWGGVVFLPYAFCLCRTSGKENLDTLLQKL